MTMDLQNTLSQTLTPEGVQGLAQALAAQQAAELQRRTQELQQSAGQAQQQFGQAAAQPTPTLSPVEQSLPQLFGDVASILSGNQNYHEEAQQRILGQKNALMEQRKAVLQNLHDVWQQKADAAQQAGNIEAELNARTKQDQVNKAYQQVLEAQHEQTMLAAAKIAGSSRVESAGLGAGARVEAARITGTSRENVAGTAAKARIQAAQIAADARLRAPTISAMFKQGMDEDGNLLPTWAQAQMTKNFNLAKKGSPASQKMAYQEGMAVAEKRWTTDRDQMTMAKRLMAVPHPYSGDNQQNLRYGLTGQKVYKRANPSDIMSDPSLKARGVKPGDLIFDPETRRRAAQRAAEVVRQQDWSDQQPEGQ
jgi:hypothetical protein